MVCFATLIFIVKIQSINTRIIAKGVTIKMTCLRGRVTVRRGADEINFGGGVSTTDVFPTEINFFDRK